MTRAEAHDDGGEPRETLAADTRADAAVAARVAPKQPRPTAGYRRPEQPGAFDWAGDPGRGAAWGGSATGYHPVVDVLRDVAAATPRRRVRSGRASWVARTALAGLVDVGALEALRAERLLISTVRMPCKTPRVIAIVAGKGGVGASATAIGLARALAALREDHVALVDAHAAAGMSLSQRVLGRPGPTVITVGTGRRIRPPSSRRGLSVVDAAAWSDPADGPEIVDAVHRVADSHSFIILDVGNDASPAAQAALALADHAVVVTSADPAATASVTGALERVAADARPRNGGERPVTVVVVRTRRGRLGRVRGLLHRSVDRAPVVVPYDRSLGDGEPAGLDGLARGTRFAYLGLAVLVAAN